MLTSEQIERDRAKAKKKLDQGAADFTKATICVKGIREEDHETAWQHIMEWVGKCTGLHWNQDIRTAEGTQASGSKKPKKGTWRIAYNGIGAHTGRVEVFPETQDDTRNLVKYAHGTSVVIEGLYRVVKVVTEVPDCDWSGEQVLTPAGEPPDIRRCP